MIGGKFYIGDVAGSKIYLGTVLIWSAAPSTISYTAEIEIGGSGAGVFSDVSGWTLDTPFTFPIVAGAGVQTRNGNDMSPITMVAGYNNTGKSAAVILLKNSVTQQTIAVTGASPPQTFNPIIIEDGDTVKVQGN